MTRVNLENIKWSFNKKTCEKGTIIISEKEVPFDTNYEVVSPNNGVKTFTFTHSTGTEFSPDTKWMYISEDGIELAICNDPHMVKIAAEQAKLKR